MKFCRSLRLLNRNGTNRRTQGLRPFHLQLKGANDMNKHTGLLARFLQNPDPFVSLCFWWILVPGVLALAFLIVYGLLF